MIRDPDELKNIEAISAEVPSLAVPPDPPVDDLLGTTYLGKYELLEVLGTGGMGVIYLGRQIFLDRSVAIKMLKNDLASVKARTRFHQEAKAASALKHPGIVSILDFGVDDLDRPYMVMEHVEGCTVADLLNERLTLPLEDILPIFLEICDALAEAHKKGIVHRDLKPSNIMIIVDDDGEPHIKILDFGIAKMLELEDRTFQDLTKTGDALGTPLYMSPEQIEGKNVTYRSDLYSLGCMLYTCLTGAPPFIGENKMATMDMHCTEKPMSLSEASDGMEFPPGIEGIVMRLLEKRAENRYDSVDELKAALIAMAAQNDLVPVPNNPPTGGANQHLTGAHPEAPGSKSSRSSKSDRINPTTSNTDPTESERRLERSSSTMYWKSDLSDRVKAARADKFKNLPKRGLPFAEQEESASSRVEASLNRSFAMGGAVIAVLLVIGAGVAWIGGNSQATHMAQNIFSANKTKSDDSAIARATPDTKSDTPATASSSSTIPAVTEATPTTISATPVASSATPAITGATPAITGATPAITGATPAIGAAIPLATSDPSDTSIGPDLTERSADDIINDRLRAGAADTSLSLKEQDGLTDRGMEYLEHFKLLRNLDLRATNLQPGFTKHLVDTQVSTLTLDVNKGITDASLIDLGHMQNLQYLSLSQTGISDQGLNYIAHCPMINSLWLGYNPAITDQGVKNLAPETSPLRSLFLNYCNITDAAAPDLVKFDYMFSLDLSNNPKISDRTLEILEGKTNGLQFLVLANDKIGDAGIHALTHYKKLRVLDLSGIRLSPRGLADLGSMKGLVTLYLVGCKLSPNEISRLCKSMPATAVETNNRVRSRLL